jgi:hypothetical protein
LGKGLDPLVEDMAQRTRLDRWTWPLQIATRAFWNCFGAMRFRSREMRMRDIGISSLLSPRAWGWRRRRSQQFRPRGSLIH